MKNLLTVFVFVFGLTGASAQSRKTEQIQVWGNCSMCKQKIELAAKGKGVQYASWDGNTQTLTVVYKTKETSTDQIQSRICEIGYDTKHCAGSDKAYSSLPACCQYDRRDGRAGSGVKH
jgi:periplasmic mercuric ion binding protein